MHIVIWGFLGEAFPFFKPNFTKMEEYGRDMGADEVTAFYQASLIRRCLFHPVCGYMGAFEVTSPKITSH